MANEDGTVWTVFNGEIYNHLELRHALEAKGHIFRGRSDTEVLPHLYEEEGPAFVTKLRGMFAVAIYDKRNQTLLLARDRFGIKPLFYAPGRNRLAFASEIRALLELPGIDRRLDRQALYDFVALFYIPAPETFYVGVRALQPGEMLEARLDASGVSWKTRTYHRWTIAPDPSMTLARAADQTEALVEAAVRRQLESDAPLGALLSGGIDSSLVCAAGQSALNGELQTFNVRFSEKEYDETWAAVAVAEHIRSRHETLDMDGVRGTWDQVKDLLLHAGQPFADTSLFAVNAVCRLMRQRVKVALSGDGGDEAFGGYNHYWQIARIARCQRLPAPLWRAASTVAVPLVWSGYLPAHLPQRLNDLAGADDISIIQSLFSWVREDEQMRLWADDMNVLPIRRLFDPQWEYHTPAGASRLEWLSAYATEANVRLSLPNDFLFKVDTASMKEGLEVRVPMLDEDLFAFGLTLPHSLKVKGQLCKLVLRRVAQRWLPREVATKPKQGFGIPVDTWIDSRCKIRIRETLLGKESHLPEFIRPEAYRPLIEAFCNGQAYPGISRQGLYQRIIMFLSLHLALSSRHSTDSILSI